MFATTVMDLISMMSNSDYVMIIGGVTRGGSPTLYGGYATELKDSDRDYHNAIKERFIDHIKIEKEKLWIYTKDIDGTYSIDDFTSRRMILLDIVQHTDQKEEVIIYDNNGHELYNGRVEYLIYNENGVLNPLCLKEVTWFESDRNSDDYPCTTIYIDEGVLKI